MKRILLASLAAYLFGLAGGWQLGRAHQEAQKPPQAAPSPPEPCRADLERPACQEAAYACASAVERLAAAEDGCRRFLLLDAPAPAPWPKVRR